MNTIQVELQVLVTSNNETNAVEQIQNGRTNHNGDAVSTPAGPVPRPARYTGPVGTTILLLRIKSGDGS